MVALTSWIESEETANAVASSYPETGDFKPKTRVWDFFGDDPDRVGKLAPQVVDRVWVIELRIYDVRRSPSFGQRGELRAALAGAVTFIGEEGGRDRVLDDLVHIGMYGGDLGVAMTNNIIANGLTVNLDRNLEVASASASTRTLNLNPRHSLYFSGSGNGIVNSGAETIGHELGHALIDLRDPFNVSLVQNNLAMNFRDNGYEGLHRDEYGGYQVFPDSGQDGRVWYPSGFGYPTRLPNEMWWREFHRSLKKRNKFIQEWK